MIKIKDIIKEYDGRRILNIDELIFDDNKIYSIMGANGSGKSTLLRILAGVLPADSGTVGHSIVNKRKIGYLPQKPYGFGFSVLKNVEMALDKNKSRTEEAKEALKAVGMLKMAESKGSTLSGGETQRMALARVMAYPREALLLDEPTSASDISGIDLIETAILEYKKRNQCTVIFSTHMPAQALRLADVVIFLDNGVIAEWGSAEKVLTRTENEVTKQFLKHWRI